MTNEEAARFLEIVKHYEGKLIPVDQLTMEAINIAIKSLENKPTNGDMIEVMFPNLECETIGDSVLTDMDNGTWFSLDWWNAPYKRR